MAAIIDNSDDHNSADDKKCSQEIKGLRRLLASDKRLSINLRIMRNNNQLYANQVHFVDSATLRSRFFVCEMSVCCKILLMKMS